MLISEEAKARIERIKERLADRQHKSDWQDDSFGIIHVFPEEEKRVNPNFVAFIDEEYNKTDDPDLFNVCEECYGAEAQLIAAAPNDLEFLINLIEKMSQAKIFVPDLNFMSSCVQRLLPQSSFKKYEDRGTAVQVDFVINGNLHSLIYDSENTSKNLWCLKSPTFNLSGETFDEILTKYKGG